MKTLLLLILLINSPVWGQIQFASVEEERKNLDEQIKRNDEWEKTQEKTLADTEAILKKNQARMAQLEDAEKNRQAYADQVLQEIDDKIGSFSTAQRLVSRRASFYRCIRGSIKDFGISDIPRCKRFHPVETDAEEDKLLNSWNTKVGLNVSQIKAEKAKLGWENQSKQIMIENAKVQIRNAQAMRVRYSDSDVYLKSREAEQVLLEKNQKYLNCDAATPDISLEEKVPYPGADFQGPFVNVPRDNQDGLGTCYANAAKNLLVGASQGKDIASFLDIALAYKGSSGVASSGLDAGESCLALSKLNEKGFCDQKNAPMEIGESNPLNGEGFLRGKKGTVYDQAIVVRLLHQFLAGREVLEKGNKEFSEQLLKQSKNIVHNLKLRPNVIIPLPIVRFPIPAKWKLAELHAIVNAKNKNLSFDQFNDDYQKEYRKFYPSYVRGVIEGKSRDEIFDVFQTKMTDFISKYGIQNEMKHWRNIFKQDTQVDVDSKTLKKDITESVEFMKIMSGKQGKTNEEFLKFCDETQGDSLQFLSTLRPLIKHLNELGVNTDDLYDKDGKFRDPAELMQLAIAPSCIHADNRKKFSSPIVCETGYGTVMNIKNSKLPYPEKVKQLRGKVVVNLLQGYPMGNTFARHINTIVGMRFNKQLNRCEYKIRESQDATSTWQSEAQLFDVMSALTEVRRK